MTFIPKYNLLLLLLANLASQYTPLNGISSLLFILALLLGCVSILVNSNLLASKDYRKDTPMIFAIIGIYFAYQFTLGIQNWSGEGWQYFLARIITLLIFYFGIITNYDFYYKRIILYQSIAIALCILYGTIMDPTNAQGRMYLGFGNPNSTSAIATIGFAGFLFAFEKNKLLTLIGCLICAWGVLAGGSRTMIILSAIACILRFRLSIKMLVPFIGIMFILLVILPKFGFNTIGIDRVVDVFSTGNFIGSRERVREATIMMINLRPIEGWGFKSGIQGDAAMITQLGSHNGYLDIIKSMGYPLGLLLLSVFVLYAIKLRKLIFINDYIINYHLFIIIAVLLGAMYESMLHGVNYFLNTLFYTSFCLMYLKLRDSQDEVQISDNSTDL